jgi:signal transduction histidine kinase
MQRTSRGASIATLLVLLAGGWASRAQEGVALTASTTRLALTPWLSVYRDASGALTLNQVQAAARAGRFQPSQQPWPAFGFTTDTVWARWAVRSEAADPTLWLTELRTARMGELDWYLVREHGPVEHLAAGNLRPRAPEMVTVRCPVFALRLAPGERAEVFLRVHSETALHLPLQIWEPKAFAAAQAGNEATFAAFFGYLAALILLSLVLSLSTRDRGYLLYSLSLLGVFGIYFVTSGHYVWLRLPGGRFAVQGGVILAIEYTLLLLLLYLRYFFDLPATLPKLNRWVIRLAWGVLPSTVVFLLGPYHIMDQLVILQALLFGVGSLTLSLVAWWQGNRVARFYALAWLSFWLLFVLTQCQLFGWLAMPTLPELQAILGVALSVTFFFLAMADRVRRVHRNMEQAQRQVLALEQQASRELRAQMQQQQQLIRDLHDGIGGLNANVAILAEMGRRDAADDKDRASFERICALASEGSAEVRSLMNSMEAREVQWPDLIDECRRHGHMVLTAHGIDFDQVVSGPSDLPGPGLFPGMSLFRVFKEALTNTIKHSGARRVEVRLEFTPHAFRLTVRDDGRGMGDTPGAGRGQANMAARIAELGGTMTCRSDAGTQLVFALPLPLQTRADGPAGPGPGPASAAPQMFAPRTQPSVPPWRLAPVCFNRRP